MGVAYAAHAGQSVKACTKRTGSALLRRTQFQIQVIPQVIRRMSRYRPPQPRGSKFITQAGWQVLKDELDHLWKVLRPQVTQAVSEAAAQGDRSENAEYIYGKKQLREIDSRVRFLRQR